MKITFGGGVSPEQREEFARWWLRNGLAGTEHLGWVRVDLLRRTITFTRFVGESMPGDPDFPELRRDTDNDRLTEELTVCLLAEPPACLWHRGLFAEPA